MKTYFLILCLLFSSNLFAQEIDKSIVNQSFIDKYKENSDFSYTSPLSEIGAPSKYILSGKLTTTYMILGARQSRLAFALIPDFTVRVRQEKSAGVRTPSFRLGGSAYYRINSDPQHYKYAELSFTHHSNGQDGDAVNTDGTINTYNGNFSTNYLTSSYRFGNFTEVNANQSYFSTNYRIGLEWHKWFSYEKALENNYGFTRLLYNLSWRKYDIYNAQKGKPWKKGTDDLATEKMDKETMRINLEVNYAVNQMSDYNFSDVKKRLNAELAVHYSFPFMNNVFLMLCGGYYGEDPYNIYFNDKYGYVRFGLSSGFIKNKISKL